MHRIAAELGAGQSGQPQVPGDLTASPSVASTSCSWRSARQWADYRQRRRWAASRCGPHPRRCAPTARAWRGAHVGRTAAGGVRRWRAGPGAPGAADVAVTGPAPQDVLPLGATGDPSAHASRYRDRGRQRGRAAPRRHADAVRRARPGQPPSRVACCRYALSHAPCLPCWFHRPGRPGWAGDPGRGGGGTAGRAGRGAPGRRRGRGRQRAPRAGRRAAARRAGHAGRAVPVRRRVRAGAARHRRTRSRRSPTRSPPSRPTRRRTRYWCSPTRAGPRARRCSPRWASSGCPRSTARRSPGWGSGCSSSAASSARAGRTVEDSGVRALLDALGNDLRELAAASSQLAADTTGVIDQAVVARYYRGRAEASGFSVADRAVEGRLAEALELLRWALADRGVPGADHQRPGRRESGCSAGWAAPPAARPDARGRRGRHAAVEGGPGPPAAARLDPGRRGPAPGRRSRSRRPGQRRRHERRLRPGSGRSARSSPAAPSPAPGSGP